MDNFYKILDTKNLAIILDGKVAIELRKKVMEQNHYLTLKNRGTKSPDSCKLDLVKNSYLLNSLGFNSASSCTLHMNPSQLQFFNRDRWNYDELPWILGADEGEVLYCSHNVDINHQREQLMKLWDNWFSFTKFLLQDRLNPSNT